MAEESIILISKDYADSNLIERGEYTELENKVNGKQDMLTAGTGINLNDNTISVDTATAVGDSNLPVTASAVNAKLGDYATTTDLNNKQDKLSWYSESGSGGMDPYKVDIAANEVTLRAGGDTVGMISENVRLTLSQNYGDKTDIKIETFSDSSASWHNVLSATRYGEISLGDPQTSVYINGRPILVKDEITFEHSVYIQGPIVDNNTNITLIQGKETWDGSGVDQVVIGDGSHSVYINGPLYDKNGNEIAGEGSGPSFNYISESNGWPYSLSLGRGPNGTANSIFVCGPLYGEDEAILVKGDITFEHSVYIQGPIVDKNNYITLIQGKEPWDGSGLHQVVIGDGSHSVYINGPLYDKNGNEITGGGGGAGGSKYIKDVSDIMGEVVAIGDHDGVKPYAIDISGDRYLILSVGTKRIFIDETKLAKLEELLNGQG